MVTMTSYWILFLVPVLALFSPIYFRGRARDFAWFSFLFISILFIGLRHQVGGDWDNYLFFSERLSREPFDIILGSKDGGYNLLVWVSAKLGWSIYGANLFCAVVFLGGLTYFCRRQPYPLLAWIISTPYLIIVVGMGYTRQSIAVGLLCFGLIFLQEAKGWRALASVLLATAFHKSALLLLPLGAILVTRAHLAVVRDTLRKGLVSGPILVSGLIFITLTGVVTFINADIFYAEFKSYVLSGQWHSEGGRVRSFMNGIPAIFLLVFWRRWTEVNGDSILWFVLALIAVIAMVVTPFFSTFSDRMGIYLIPLQIYVISRIPLLIQNEALRQGGIIGICALYGVVLFVWLNHASHAFYWLPYKSLLWH